MKVRSKFLIACLALLMVGVSVQAQEKSFSELDNTANFRTGKIYKLKQQGGSKSKNQEWADKVNKLDEEFQKKVLGDDYEKEQKKLKGTGLSVEERAKVRKDIAKWADEQGYPTYDYPLTYDKFKNHLKPFTSKVYFKDDWLGFGTETNYLINSFAQGFFWFNKFLFSINASIYEAFKEDGTIGNKIVDVINVSGDIFVHFLSSDMLILLGGLFVSYAFFQHVKGRKNFFSSLLKLFAVFGVTMVLFTRTATGDYYLARAYHNMDSAISSVANQVTVFTDKYQEEGYGSDNVLDLYFKEAIWKPYIYMNSDEVSEDKASDAWGRNFSEAELKALLAYDADDSDFKMAIKGEKEKVGMDKIVYDGKKVKVENLSSNWGVKFSYAIGSIIKTTLLGTILVAFAILTFLLKIMLLILFSLSPFIFIISLIPTMETVLFNFGKQVTIITSLSGFMSFITTLALYIYGLIENAILSLYPNDYLIAVFLEVIIFIVIWKKRAWLLSILTADRVRVSGNFGRFSNPLKHVRRTRKNGGHSLSNDMTKMALAKNAMRGVRRKSWQGLKNYNHRLREDGLMIRQGVSRNTARRKVKQVSDARKHKIEKLKSGFSDSLNYFRQKGLKLAHEGAKDDKTRERINQRLKANVASKVKNNTQIRKERLKQGKELKRSRPYERYETVKAVEDVQKKTGLSTRDAYKKYHHDMRVQKRNELLKTVPKPRVPKEPSVAKQTPYKKYIDLSKYRPNMANS